MHNCRDVKERFTELILDGIDVRSDEVLSAELNKCADCRSEFHAINTTLRTTTRLREAVAPAGSYWTSYHATLREKLSQAKVRRCKENTGASFAPLRLCARTFFLPVPVPLGLAAIIICVFVGIFAFRSAGQPAAQDPVIVHVPVQVPVVQEKIVTRVVYRDRYLPSRSASRTRQNSPVENTFARSQKPRPDDIPALTGFKPAEDVKLTVIKGGSPNEK